MIKYYGAVKKGEVLINAVTTDAFELHFCKAIL